MPQRPDISATLPQLQDAESALHEYANNVLGIDYGFADYGTLRSEADTVDILQFRQDDYAAAVRANPRVASTPITSWRPIAPYGKSWHDYGAAFDVAITDKGNFESAGAALSALKNVATRFGLTSAVPNDPPHFELGVPLSQARQLWLDYTGDAPDLPPSDGTADVAALSTVAVVGVLLLLVRKLMK